MYNKRQNTKPLFAEVQLAEDEVCQQASYTITTTKLWTEHVLCF